MDGKVKKQRGATERSRLGAVVLCAPCAVPWHSQYRQTPLTFLPIFTWTSCESVADDIDEVPCVVVLCLRGLIPSGGIVASELYEEVYVISPVAAGDIDEAPGVVVSSVVVLRLRW